MTKIEIYDVEAEAIEKCADVNDISVAEVVEMIMEYFEDMKVDHNLK